MILTAQNRQATVPLSQTSGGYRFPTVDPDTAKSIAAPFRPTARITILLLAAWITAAPSSAGTAKIIDMHCHTAGIGAGDSGCFVSPRLRKSYKFRIYLWALGIDLETLETHGDQRVVDLISEKVRQAPSVDQAVVLAMDGHYLHGRLDYENTEFYVPNRFLAGAVKKHPNLLWGASINPHRRDWAEELSWCLEQGAVLLKWIPSIQGINPMDPSLIPFYRALAENRLPLLVHTGRERSFTRAYDAWADPARLELPLSLGVTVIAAHMAGSGKQEGESNFQRLMPLLERHDALYTDISSLTQINKLGILKKGLQRPLVVERMLFGTDFPLQFFPLTSALYFPGMLSLKDQVALWQLSNPFERDYQLKKRAGVPEAVFHRAATILRLPKDGENAIQNP